MTADEPKRRLSVHDVIGALGDLPEGEDSVSVIRKQRDAADRPSVTDNASDEEQGGYTVQQTAAHFARSVQRVSDRIRSTDYQRSVSDIVALDNVEGFLDRIARDDLDVFAAGRAETTTATTEDAARVLQEQYDQWLLRMHGIESSCDHSVEAEHTAKALFHHFHITERTDR